MTVARMATLLGVKPFQVIAELMKDDVFMSIHDELPRGQIGKMLSRRGFAAVFDPMNNR
jgi:hypothetical protein